MGCPPRTHKADIEASPGIAEKARAWMAEQSDERIFAFHLIRKFGGRALRRRRSDDDVYLCGAEFEDGSRLTFRILEGSAPDQDEIWLDSDRLQTGVPLSPERARKLAGLE